MATPEKCYIICFLFLLVGCSTSESNRMIVFNKLAGSSGQISHISHQLPGGSMTIIRSFAPAQNYNLYAPIQNYFTSAQPASIENITPNYASQIYTDYNTRNPLQFHSQKIREFSTSTPAPYQPTHFQPTPAAPSQPAVTANYNPAVNSIQSPFTASPRQPAVSVVHRTTPGVYQMDDMSLGYFDSQITQKTRPSTKATEHYTPTSISRPTIKHPVGVSINPVMKNKANMKDEHHIPEYDTIYNGVYGEREHYIPEKDKSSQGLEENELNKMNQQDTKVLTGHVSNEEYLLQRRKQALQNVLMRDLESHSNLHGVVDMDQMYLPDGMQPPEYITPDQNETPGPFAPRFQVDKREISEEEAMKEIQQALEDANIYPDILTQVPEALVNINYGFHGCVHLGTEMDPYMTVSRPRRITFPANSTDYHTLALLNANTKTLLWLVVNIEGGKVLNGQEIAVYQPPASSPDMHNAAILDETIMMAVWRQQRGMVYNSEGYFGARICEWDRRVDFDLMFLIDKLDLELVAANFYTTYSEPMISQETCYV